MTSDPTSGADPEPYGAAELRRRVLAGWADSPARFREDANAEEDFARTGYADRLVVELAQNAADAASRAGVAGRLLLRLEPDLLLAANTGAPLDAAGVEALSTLRASAKRDDDEAATVGRFGVGFAAVLAVTDDPRIVSTTGDVSWHRSWTRREVAALPALAGELERRGGDVPVLRLPWAQPGPPLAARDELAGYDTVVVLPLRDASALALAQRLLDELDAGLLLMLPSLAEVVVDDGTRLDDHGLPMARRRTLSAADLHVRSVGRSGRLEPELLADRPVEERRLTSWSVRWATPRPAGVPAVVHAPTPTDEPLDLPALLLASFPLDASRRRVAGGPLRDFLVAQAAQAYVDLVREEASREPAAEPVLALVPGAAAAGALDAEIRRDVLDLLRRAPILAGGLRPDEAVAVDGLPDAAHDVLAPVVPGLLPPEWARRPELDRVGVRRTRLADLVDDLATLSRPAAWWRDLYASLEGADREALSGLPVPLADGRVVRGPRSVVVGADPELAAALVALGLRVADPDATYPLLERLGAVPADPRLLLDDPAVHAAVDSSLDADDPATVSEAVLGLVRQALPDAVDGGRAAREPGRRDALPGLAGLALLDDEGEWAPAGELVLTGGRLAGLLAPGALGAVDAAWVERWGARVLAAVGVLETFAVVRDADVAVDPDLTDHDLDGEDAWLEDVLDDVLDHLGDDGLAGRGLPPVLPELLAVRDLDLVDPARWPDALRLVAADPELRAAVVEPQRVVLPDGAAVRVPSYTAWWLRTHPVLDGRRPDGLHAPGLGGLLGGLLSEAPDLGLDAEFLAAIGVATSVAELAPSPMLLPLLRAGLSVDGAAEDDPDDGGTELAVPEVVAGLVPQAPRTYVEHADLRVRGVECDWWVTSGVDGRPAVVHAATLEGLARGLAWAAGRWDLRLLLAAVLAEPDRADDLVAEESWL